MKYQVEVGNIGTVYDGNHEQTAIDTFNEYHNLSSSGYGRCAYEPVTLMQDGEPVDSLWFENEE